MCIRDSANVWKASVGRIPLYLLDTDNELNSEFDRPIDVYKRQIYLYI